MMRGIFVFIMVIFLLGCGTTIERKQLEGKWYINSVTNIDKNENVILTDCVSYEFMSNGEVEALNPNKTIGEWRLVSNELTVKMILLDGRVEKNVFLVDSLDSLELILEIDGAKLHLSRQCDYPQD